MNALLKGNLLRLPYLHYFFCCLFSLSYVGLHAQTEMICDGITQTITAGGDVTDLLLPTDTSITQIELIAHGGDGGFADLGNSCFSEGGGGAHATAQFDLGDAAGAIPYGSTVRFIVGIAGEKGTGGTVLGTGNTYGGGGGGTGILYKAPDSDEWAVLMVAGGGGGAYQGSIIGICVDSKTGEGGRADLNGGDGNGANGGMGGMVGSGGMAGGLDGLEVSGGGGGAYTKGEGITCVGLDGSTEVAEGQLGFPNGGAGGGNEGCAGSTYRDGGFGFGGGASGQGGGGGGGGFSGGGGGGNAGRGGGGGSYIVAAALNPIIEAGGLTSLTEDGFAQYRCIKRIDPMEEPPVAECVETTVLVSLDADGGAALIPALISSDTLNPAWSYSLSADEFTCENLGESTVSLLVETSDGQTDSCTTTVRIVDEQAPELECPVSVEVSCDDDFSVDALGTATAIDNCGNSELVMTEISASGDCAGAQTLTRTWTATDDSGNSATCNQVIAVSDTEAPACENCPADLTVNCGSVPKLPELELSDNCDQNPGISLEVSSTQADDGCGALSYTETRTWTVSDACGNTSEYVQVITVVDDQAPECLNCPEDITVDCGLALEPYRLEVTDNCDAEPSITEVVTSTRASDRSCGAYAYTETHTWTISDACGNAIEHVQVITFEDTSAPEINCPPTITVTCDNDPSLAGFPAVIDNCDPSPVIAFDDVILSGNCDWACRIERTWTATDVCGNTSACVQTIEQSAQGLMEDALSEDLDGDGLEDPLVIGRLGRHSLTVTSAGAACLLDWLPNNGGEAWPLVRTDFLIDGSDCSPEGLPIGEDGKLNNPLIAETLIMGIKLRLDPGAGEVRLSDLDCAIHPIVFQGLPRNPTVSDLYDQANLVVGNIISLPFTDYFVEALGCINGTGGFCPDGEELAFSEVTPDLNLKSAHQLSGSMTVYPNPARAQFWLDLSAFSGQQAQLRLFNAVGQNVLDRQLQEISTEPIAFQTDGLSNGVYVLQVRVGDQVMTEQVLVQGK